MSDWCTPSYADYRGSYVVLGTCLLDVATNKYGKDKSKAVPALN
jgi:hypothetical protein